MRLVGWEGKTRKPLSLIVMPKTQQSNHFSMALPLLATIFCGSVDGNQLMIKMTYSRAYSFVIIPNTKTAICYNDSMDILIRLKAASKLSCLKKCQDAIGMNLRGFNYKKSVESCSCVPKLDVLYNLTTDLGGECLAYVTQNCPPKFDYVIENHKCYKLQKVMITWSGARTRCNNFVSSHPIVMEQFNEMTAARWYSVSVFPFDPAKDTASLWTAGYRTYINDLATPFLWEPYPSWNVLYDSPHVHSFPFELGHYDSSARHLEHYTTAPPNVITDQNTSIKNFLWRSNNPNQLQNDNTSYCIVYKLSWDIGFDDKKLSNID
ncbi:hypothetical protein HELRODRAFT_172168 [Helobdella robusta]|uniref:C-type lectin domain-containing protein n=1 Tax=Helobdella robusta TaxID=6412 RepID=T1F538_HELRO|nr:hypothetical protein HELRODRAFT_172168 [Helobdella robusta]ESO04521.1 hypothetical protein HELRODRAFT_172168 [Helobdella robusta]